MTHAAGVVRDSHPFDGTPLLRQEVIRIMGIELDLAMAGRLESKWLERQRIKPTFSATTTLAAYERMKLDICAAGG